MRAVMATRLSDRQGPVTKSRGAACCRKDGYNLSIADHATADQIDAWYLHQPCRCVLPQLL